MPLDETMTEHDLLMAAEQRILALEAEVDDLAAHARETERRRAAWKETAAQMQRNTEFYRGLVTQMGEMFGPRAKTSDDGTVQEDVLALKVPELVRQCLRGYEVLQEEQAGILAELQRISTLLEAGVADVQQERTR